MVDKRPREEIADAQTVLRQKVDEFVTGKSEMPTTLGVTKIPQLLSSVNTTLYNSDHVDLREAPQVEIRKVNLQPSPTPPPAVPVPPIVPEGSPDPPHRHSQGDAVVVSFMDNGRNPDIAREAATKPLASDHEKDFEDGIEKGVQEGAWKKSRKVGRKELRKGLRKGLRRELRRLKRESRKNRGQNRRK